MKLIMELMLELKVVLILIYIKTEQDRVLEMKPNIET